MAHPNEMSSEAAGRVTAEDRDMGIRVVSAKTRQAFHDLLDSATVLSGDQGIRAILDNVERIPSLEDKIKQNDESLRTHEKTRQQALHDYNSDRDTWMLEKQQLIESCALQRNELASMNEVTRSLKNEKASCASEVQTLKENEGKQNLDMENRQKQIQGLVKAIETARQDISVLKSSIASCESRTKEVEHEHSELQKIHTRARTEADAATQQLQETTRLFVPLSEDLAPSMPMPEGNTDAGKHMRCVAILGSLARGFTDSLFQPTYLLPENSGIRDMLLRQANADPERESTLRALLQGSLPNEQEHAASKRVETVCNRLMMEVSFLLSSDENARLQKSLTILADEASEAWREICCFTEAVAPSFEIVQFTEWSWNSLIYKAGRLVIDEQAQQAGDNREQIVFVVFPRLYDGERHPETHGVLFMWSEAQAPMRDVAPVQLSSRQGRSDSTRSRLHSRKPSTGVASDHTHSGRQFFLGPSTNGQ
ncbi:hypothetical protein LTR48_003000 [Friedmanniomyces endolithicus]|uniref:Uncharacterized protein n=1 Tax=Rachicladosporium monterosium TaxID=1507873 RepID=A0ABR0L9Q1_9PEZI|nr:hypothetical protein LTR48_003000 [Friedmanniomyces endolithicus]KAK5145657.1 hypothetical protein LTR32_002630 [Rachicladosporium monterosium]